MIAAIGRFNGHLRHRLRYCTKSADAAKSYKNTVLLPATKFPLRLEGQRLVKRDEAVTATGGFEHYYKWQRCQLSEPEFVLHDGPPYANGDLHMGHAINKILKDTILRYKVLNGRKVHYVPGWDCHGLPIELKAGADLSSGPLEVRGKARDLAQRTIERHKAAFRSWGLLGDWGSHYATYSNSYVKMQFKLFYKMYKKGVILQGVKPVYWSPSARTALAEAELEYNETHRSPSAYVRFKINNFKSDASDRVYALIWTTTPWTLPANQAICYNPALEYCLVKKPMDAALYLVAKPLVESLKSALKTDLEIMQDCRVDAFSKCTYVHPMSKRELRFLPASHASGAKGTGLVHTAPAHGHDDFFVALNNNITPVNLVDATGCYEDGAGAELSGKFVLSEGNDKVLEMVKDDVLHLAEIEHSYPYDWRTKTPVIIRATEQWFVDTDAVKARAIELLEDVQFFPKANSDICRRSLVSHIQRRPYWCISRQRKWGVPIPVLRNVSTNEVLVTEDLIGHYCELLDRKGPDFWWTVPMKDMLPANLTDTLNFEQLERGQDILDIWFDSGISWASALEGDKVADMCVEGADQFNGWFQSLLITSVALRDKAPYKSVYVHGFAVDENGNKMSKSLGNVVDPMEVVRGSTARKPMGVDTLRWWVACHTSQDSIANVSNNVLQNCSDEVQKIRSVLRFVLGSMDYYQPSLASYESCSLLDKYMLGLLHDFHLETQAAIDEYLFHKVNTNVLNLLTNAVSALYFTAIKDRLYCSPSDSASRQSAQFVLFHIFETVTQAVAPIIPHMVEEMCQHFEPYSRTGKTYFATAHSAPDPRWNSPRVSEVMGVALEVRREVHRQAGPNTTNLRAQIGLSAKVWKALEELGVHAKEFASELEDILQVSEVSLGQIAGSATVEAPSTADFSLNITRNATKFPCARCRRVKAECQDVLCDRCSDLLKDTTTVKTAGIN